MQSKRIKDAMHLLRRFARERNPSLCAKVKTLENADFFSIFEGFCMFFGFFAIFKIFQNLLFYVGVGSQKVVNQSAMHLLRRFARKRKFSLCDFSSFFDFEFQSMGQAPACSGFITQFFSYAFNSLTSMAVVDSSREISSSTSP